MSPASHASLQKKSTSQRHCLLAKVCSQHPITNSSILGLIRAAHFSVGCSSFGVKLAKERKGKGQISGTKGKIRAGRSIYFHIWHRMSQRTMLCRPVAQCVCEIPSLVKHAKAIKNESEGCHFPLGLMSRFVTFLSAILTQDNGDFPLTDRFDHWNYMLLQTAWIYFLFWVKLWLPTRPLALIQNAVWYIVPLSPQSKLVGGLVFVCAKPHFIWGAHSPTFSGEAAILFLVVVQSCFPITERLRGYTTDCTICYRTEDKNKRHLKGLGALHNRSIKSTVQSLILTCLACFTW